MDLTNIRRRQQRKRWKKEIGLGYWLHCIPDSFWWLSISKIDAAKLRYVHWNGAKITVFSMWTESLSGMVFMPTQKLSVMVWIFDRLEIRTFRCFVHTKSPLKVRKFRLLAAVQSSVWTVLKYWTVSVRGVRLISFSIIFRVVLVNSIFISFFFRRLYFI